MANLNHSLEDFLQETRILIGNSQALPEISAVLAGYGYTQRRLSEGQTLLQATESLVLAQKKEYGEQYEATAAVQAAWDEADRVYSKTVKVARLVFADDVQAMTALKLTGSRRATLAGWMDQAVFFYGNLTAQPLLIAAMARFGYTTEKLLAEKALVDAVVTLSQNQAKETSEALRSTITRDASLKKLDTWVGELRTILKVAFADDPRTLEAVGISVATGGRPKKRPASAAKG